MPQSSISDLYASDLPRRVFIEEPMPTSVPASANADLDDSAPIMPPRAVHAAHTQPAIPPCLTWGALERTFPPEHVVRPFCRGKVKAHIIDGGDRVVAYIKLSPMLTGVAENLIALGVKFPQGIGYDHTIRAFVSDLQRPEVQLEIVFRWCTFLGALCAGGAATLPPGVEYESARTYSEIFA